MDDGADEAPRCSHLVTEKRRLGWTATHELPKFEPNQGFVCEWVRFEGDAYVLVGRGRFRGGLGCRIARVALLRGIEGRARGSRRARREHPPAAAGGGECGPHGREERRAPAPARA